MTIEQITHPLQTVAKNQATHSANMARIEEMQAQHAADIALVERNGSRKKKSGSKKPRAKKGTK